MVSDDEATRQVMLGGDGVVASAAPGTATFTLKCGEGEDPREQVFHLAVQKGWVLLGMSMEQVSLEEVFRKLTRN